MSRFGWKSLGLNSPPGNHESWIFPAGVSFALKQNMYWDGFCAFLPDISGLWGGGGGPNPARISKFDGGGGGRGVFPVFTLLGNP